MSHSKKPKAMNFKTNQEPNWSSVQPQTESHPSDHEINPVKQLRRMQLTEREIQALQYMAAGYTSEKIANDLYISKNTVDSHRKNIIKKLGVTNVTAAVAFALRNRLIS
jgi:DNA-binding NarL/FixJ family response regulator